VLNQTNLSTLKDDKPPSEAGSRLSSHSTAILKSIIRKATARKENSDRSETPSEFKDRVIGLVKYLLFF
jgi:hypothetical protein